MSFNRHLQEKIYRLETLRKYQAYYGPNTPFQIVSEINQLEVDLRKMLKADVTRRAQKVNHSAPPAPAVNKTVATKVAPKKAAAKRIDAQKSAAKSAKAKKTRKKQKQTSYFGMSQATVDLIATIAFIGLIFLLGSIVFAAYRQSQSPEDNIVIITQAEAKPALRPTFTPTLESGNPGVPVSDGVAVAAAGDSMLPAAVKEPTEIATPVPTLTPSESTATPTPFPTDTPGPTNTPLPPPPAPPTATPAPPTATPGPQFPFEAAETGNRTFQKTSYHAVTVYAAITTFDNVPIGGLKIVGDHTPSGRHVESGLSDWHWSVSNCLDCNYIKFGNVKFEPGTFEDGTWSIYVADAQGNQLSAAMPFSYSAAQDQWVWDFVLFRKLPGF